jgi:tryptophan halogenase
VPELSAAAKLPIQPRRGVFLVSIFHRRRRLIPASESPSIAIGLSSGFVEPLESTSTHLIMIVVSRLLQVFPFRGVSNAAAERFSTQSRREIEGICDFIVSTTD